MHAKIMATMCHLNGFIQITYERDRSLLTIEFSAQKKKKKSCNLTNIFNIFNTNIQNSNPHFSQFKINL